MDAFLTPQRIELLRAFVTALSANPKLIHNQKLSFFKEYLLSVGATLPEDDTDMQDEIPQTEKEKEKEEPKQSPKQTEPEEEPIEVEGEEVEEEMEEEEEEEEPAEPIDDLIMQPETVDLPVVNNQSENVSEEDMDNANSLKIEAINLQNEGKLEEAIQKLSQAITMNPQSGILYATRANCFLRVKRPLAAIQDCTQAIKISPDSAKPYKVRGKAYRFIGEYEKSKADLDMGNRLDFDEETYALQKFINERVSFREEIRKKKIAREERKRKKTEKRSQPKAQPQPQPQSTSQQEKREKPSMPGMNFGAGMGGLPPDFLQNLMSNPEVLSLLQDPEIAAALANPGKLAELLSNPKYAKLAEVFSKFTQK